MLEIQRHLARSMQGTTNNVEPHRDAGYGELILNWRVAFCNESVVFPEHLSSCENPGHLGSNTMQRGYSPPLFNSVHPFDSQKAGTA